MTDADAHEHDKVNPISRYMTRQKFVGKGKQSARPSENILVILAGCTAWKAAGGTDQDGH